MDPITLIATAAVVGSETIGKKVVEKGVEHLWQQFTERLKGKAKDNDKVVTALSSKDPKEVHRVIIDIGAASDPQIISNASQLIKLLPKKEIELVERQIILIGSTINFPSFERKIGVPACKIPHSMEIFGRSSEILSIIDQLLQPELISVSALWGLPGIGKTDLVRSVGCNPAIVQYFNGGVLYAELGPHADTINILRGWLTELDIPIPINSDEQILTGRIRQALGNNRVLFILDDVWSTSINTAQSVHDCMNQNCGLLVSSRSESVARTSSRGKLPIRLRPLDVQSSLELLRFHAKRDKTNPVDVEIEKAEILVEALGHLPLAIKLAGCLLRNARNELTPCSNLLRTWRQQINSLESDEIRPGFMNKELSLDEIIGISYDRLPNNEIRVMAGALSVFNHEKLDETSNLISISWDLDAMISVWDCDRKTADLAENAIISSGLLDFNDETKRYSTHQTIQMFLDKVCDNKIYMKFYSIHYAEKLRSINFKIQNKQEMISEIDIEFFHIEKGFLNAMENLPSNWAVDTVIIYAINCDNYFSIRSHYDILVSWLEKALMVAKKYGYSLEAALLLDKLGEAYHILGKYNMSILSYRESIDIKEDTGVIEGVNVLYAKLGDVYNLTGLYSKSLEAYQEGLEISEKLDDKITRASLLNSHGALFDRQKEYSKAVVYYKRSIKAMRDINNPSGEAMSLGNLGGICRSNGRYKEAITYYKNSIKISEENNDLDNLIKSNWGLGLTYRDSNELILAVDSMKRSISLLENSGGLCPPDRISELKALTDKIILENLVMDSGPS